MFVGVDCDWLIQFIFHNIISFFLSYLSITDRTADVLLPNISIAPSLSQSFLQLSIPKLYHLAESITQQLTIEMLNAQLPPIMEVDKFM